MYMSNTAESVEVIYVSAAERVDAERYVGTAERVEVDIYVSTAEIVCWYIFRNN